MKKVVPLLSGVAGGAVVLVVALITGVGGSDETTTVYQQTPLSAQTERARGPSSTTPRALTASDIYTRDAPGVVFVRAQVVGQSTSPFGYPQQGQGEATG